MLRRLLILSVVLAAVLLGSATVLADGDLEYLDKCYPVHCYVSNEHIPGTGNAKDGTSTDPFEFSEEEDRLDLRGDMMEKSVDSGPGFLTLITCDSSGQCAYVRYEYEDGQETAGEPQPGIPPEVGVKLPFPYILGGGALVGVLLVGVGIVLWRKARRGTV